MTFKTKINLILILASFAGAWALSASAATSIANFDPGSGTLSVSGSCSSRFVVVLIKNASSDSIWGSSNPPCVNGSYSYSIAVPDAMRDGGAFTVSAMDNGLPGPGTPSQPVIFSPEPQAIDVSPTIILDTSSVATTTDDASFLDGVLNNCFGVVTSAVDTIESSVIAAVQLFAKAFTILPGGSITVPEGQNQISGQGSLEAGSSEVFIANTAVTSSSQIIVTPTSPTQVPLVIEQIVDGSGFDVGVIAPQQIPVSFTWLIVNTYASGQPSSDGQQIAGPQPVQGSDDGSSVAPSGDSDQNVSSTSSDDASSTDAVATSTDASSSSVSPTPDDTDGSGVSSSTVSNDASSTDATDAAIATSTDPSEPTAPASDTISVDPSQPSSTATSSDDAGQ